MAKFTPKGYINELERQLTAAANNAVDYLEEKQKAKTPVRTGTLIRGYKQIDADRLGDSAISYNDVPYAGYVDMGTSKMAPRNMRQHAKNSMPSKANRFLP